MALESRKALLQKHAALQLAALQLLIAALDRVERAVASWPSSEKEADASSVSLLGLSWVSDPSLKCLLRCLREEI